MDILEFLNSNGIIVGEENFPKGSRKKYIWDTDNQISLIIEVQKILRGKKINFLINFISILMEIHKKRYLCERLPSKKH